MCPPRPLRLPGRLAKPASPSLDPLATLGGREGGMRFLKIEDSLRVALWRFVLLCVCVCGFFLNIM